MKVIDEILIDYKPINFYRKLGSLLLKVTLFFGAGWILFFVTSDEERSSYLKSHIGFTLFGFLLFLLIASIQVWFYGKAYIYKLSIKDGLVNLKWQEWKKFKEITVPIKFVNV